jgi:chaperonin GroES
MQNVSGIVPADVKVLVYPDPVEEKTAGGIIRPDMLRDKEKYATTKATIVGIGAGAFLEWAESDRPVVGARVVTAQYAGLRIKGNDGKEYVICNDDDIVAVLKDAQ